MTCARAPSFDWIAESPIPLPPPEQFRFRSLAEMLGRVNDDAEWDRLILVGPVGDRDAALTLADLAAEAGRAARWCADAGIGPGDSVALLRLPGTSEVPLAARLLGLMAHGVRV